MSFIRQKQIGDHSTAVMVLQYDPHRTCPKCRHKSINIEFVPSGHNGIYNDYPFRADTDGFASTCHVCGFSFYQALNTNSDNAIVDLPYKTFVGMLDIIRRTANHDSYFGHDLSRQEFDKLCKRAQDIQEKFRG